MSEPAQDNVDAPASPARRDEVLRVLALAVCYFALARLSRGFVSDEFGLAVVWPAAGFGLAVLLVRPRSEWPGLVAGFFVANVAANVLSDVSVGMAGGFAIANTAESLIGALVLAPLLGDPARISSGSRLTAFLALGTLAAPALGAVLGTAVVGLDGGDELGHAWLTWFAADALGIAVVTPFVLRLREWPLLRDRALAAESAVVLAAMVGASFGVFSAPAGNDMPLFAFPFVTLPPTVWAALRLRGPAVPACSLLLAIIAAAYTLDGRGPFISPVHDPDTEVLQLQVFLVIAAWTSAGISAVTEERRSAQAEVAASAGRLQRVLDNAFEAWVAMDARGTVIDWNRSAERMFGYPREEIVGLALAETIVPGEYREAHREGLRRYLETGEARVIGRVLTLSARRKDGTELPIELTISVRQAEEGPRFNAFIRDVTEKRAAEAQILANEMALDEVLRISHQIPTGEGVPEAICEAVREVAEADIAAIWEYDGKGSLTLSAALGAPMPEEPIAIGEEPSIAAVAFTTRERVFVPEALEEPKISQRMQQATNGRAVAVEPVMHGERAIGALAAIWLEPQHDLDPRVDIALELLASEAAVAIERRDMVRRLEELSYTDELTGLPNRRAWDRELARALAAARRREAPLSIAMVDLDRFKDYNDRHGHRAGDQFLEELAAAWREVVRDSDLVCRYRGEQFAVLLPDCGADDALDSIERMRAATPSGQTCTAAIAEVAGGEDSDGLLARVEETLTEAKRAGRDMVAVAPRASSRPSRN